MKLTEKVTGVDNDEMQSHQYKVIRHSDDSLAGLMYKCPGCNNVVYISCGPDKPHWEINFETLTAKPSIIHDRAKGGCGWHGYLTDGVLEGKIE